MGKIKYDKEFCQNVILEYSNGKSFTEVAKHFNIQRGSVQHILRKCHFVCRTRESVNRKHNFNYNFFDIIDSEDKAYWLGFILADGNIYASTVSIQLNIKDENHLKKFAVAIGYKYFRDFDKKKNACRIRLNSRHMCESLRLLSVNPHKSDNITLPLLPDELVQHFFRGFVDGDGSIYKTYTQTKNIKKYPNGKIPSLSLAMGSDSFIFLFYLKAWVSCKIGRCIGTIGRRWFEGKFRYKLAFNGNIASREAIYSLYKDNTISMDRKNLIYHSLLKQ